MLLYYYYIFVALVAVPLVVVFKKAGFRPYWAALLLVPDFGLGLCALTLAVKKWSVATSVPKSGDAA